MIHLLIKLQLHLYILAIVTPTGSGVVSMAHMLVGAKVGGLTEDLLWFVCRKFDVSSLSPGGKT